MDILTGGTNASQIASYGSERDTNSLPGFTRMEDPLSMDTERVASPSPPLQENIWETGYNTGVPSYLQEPIVTSDYSPGDGRQFEVLLIEPDPDAVSPFIDSFEATDATGEVHVVSDGNEALDFILRRGTYVDAPRPDLIILDINVKGTSGEQILKELDERPELRRIPVIVFTTSDAAEDVARTYKLNANAYVTKPASSEQFDSLAQAIEDFWFTHAQLPPE